MNNIVFSGFMGTGKSTVGRIVADRLGLTFIDTDDQIIARAGKSIADIFGAETASKVPILYGGSVKPDNAGGILSVADVDGVLVGGASLKADSFLSIVRA